MEQFDLQRHVVAALEPLGMRYVITGSVASTFYGELRFTNDIVTVAELRAEHVAAFHASFPDEDFYLSLDAMREAVSRCSQFKIIHPESGLKIDAMIPTETEFDRARLDRRKRVQTGRSSDAYLTTPEDLILKKMDFYREGGSKKHRRDIAGILRVSGERVDRAYISPWAQKLDLLEIWKTIESQTKN
jgi:hypothetical protein